MIKKLTKEEKQFLIGLKNACDKLLGLPKEELEKELRNQKGDIAKLLLNSGMFETPEWKKRFRGVGV